MTDSDMPGFVFPVASSWGGCTEWCRSNANAVPDQLLHHDAHQRMSGLSTSRPCFLFSKPGYSPIFIFRSSKCITKMSEPRWSTRS